MFLQTRVLDICILSYCIFANALVSCCCTLFTSGVINPPDCAGGGLVLLMLLSLLNVAPVISQRADGSQRRLLRLHGRWESYCGWEIGELRSRHGAMATNFVARDGVPRLYCLCWHFTTDGNITKPIVALTSTMIPLRLVNIPWTLVQYSLRSCGSFAWPKYARFRCFHHSA